MPPPLFRSSSRTELDAQSPHKAYGLSSTAACPRQTQTEISKSPQSWGSTTSPRLRGNEKRIFRFYPLLALASFVGVQESVVRSPRGLVLAPTAAAGLATVVAGAQRQVAAHAGRNEGQCHQGQPAQTELLVGRVTWAGVREVALGVWHAVVQHALRAQHAADFVDALLDWVRGVLALPPPVVFVVEHLSTIDAPRALAVLSPPPAFLGLQQGRGLGLDGCVLAQTKPHTWSNAHAGARVGVPTGTIGEEVFTLLSVHLVEGGGEVQVLAVGLRFPHDRVAVVLVATDEHVFARIDANDLLFVYLKTDVTSRLKGDNQESRARKLRKNATLPYSTT